MCVCVCGAHRCSNWFHGEDARDGRAWKADKEKRPYIILYYTVYIRIPPVLNLHLYVLYIAGTTAANYRVRQTTIYVLSR